MDVQQSFQDSQKQQKNTQQIPCKHCQRAIRTQNHPIHQARCSFIRQSNIKNAQVLQDQCEIQVPQLINNIPEKKRRKIFEPLPYEQPQNHINQLVPCPYCNYMQTLQQLDTHPRQCRYRQVPCSLCGGKFPMTLMAQHRNICQRQIQRQPQTHQQQDSQDEADLFGIFTRRQTRQQNNMNSARIIPPPVIYETAFDRPHGLHRGIRLRNNGPFGHFLGLLDAMAVRNTNSRPGQGLNTQQINKLTRISYKKTQQQEQLCTICYCALQQGQTLIKLKCKHLFHQQCVIKWLQHKAVCPLCKTCQTTRQIQQSN